MPLDVRRPPSFRGVPKNLRARFDAAASRTARRRLFVTAGRAVLWTVLAFVALRGVTSIVGDQDAPASTHAGAPGAANNWPDDEARAFALRFARAYLTRSRRYPESGQRTVAAMTAPTLRDTLAVSMPRGSQPQAVAEASVARVVDLGRARSLVTVACVVLGRSSSTRYLAVPVARDRSGALIVFDLPSFTSPPRSAGDVREPQGELLDGADAIAVEPLVRRFLTAYLAGDTEQLPFVMAPGAVPPAPLGQEYQLVELDRVERLDRERVTAVVRVREAGSRAVYALRYRLRLARADRWLVRGVEG